jgi:hypothetical protein
LFAAKVLQLLLLPMHMVQLALTASTAGYAVAASAIEMARPPTVLVLLQLLQLLQLPVSGYFCVVCTHLAYSWHAALAVTVMPSGQPCMQGQGCLYVMITILPVTLQRWNHCRTPDPLSALRPSSNNLVFQVS